MLSFHVVNTLNSSEEGQWKKLANEVLGSDVHHSRQRGFCLARAALKLCLEDFGRKIEIEKLHLEHFHAVKGVPSLTISLSHTPEWGAAIVGNSSEFISLGIDIEPVERPVKDMILERISHPEDLKIKPIEVWALKEAAFKALMNTRKFLKPVEFSSLKIGQNHWEHVDSGVCGGQKLEVKSGLVIAQAWIKI